MGNGFETGINANFYEIMLYSMLGLAAVWCALSLMRRRWDGMLQHLMVAQQLAMVNVSVWRILRLLGYISLEPVNFLCVGPMLIVQIWLAWFLHRHISH
jgi:hypothetical protein